MPNDCIFCKIASKEIPVDIVYENDKFIAFSDIKPKAVVHIILIPKQHIGPHSSLSDEDSEMIGEMMIVAGTVARQKGIDRSGYRLVMNSGPDSGMEVEHLHLHILGGNKLGPIG